MYENQILWERNLENNWQAQNIYALIVASRVKNIIRSKIWEDWWSNLHLSIIFCRNSLFVIFPRLCHLFDFILMFLQHLWGKMDWFAYLHIPTPKDLFSHLETCRFINTNISYASISKLIYVAVPFHQNEYFSQFIND